MIKLTRVEIFQKQELVKKFKPLIDHLVECELDTFLKELKEIQEWDRSRDDLYVWIPVLNRIDKLLSDIIEKYNYKTTDFKRKAVKLVTMADQDVKICIVLAEFTCRLLYNTENRFIYSSMDVMNNLLNCPNFEVKLCAIKILAVMGERYLIARQRIDSENILSNHNLKKKALKLALAIPSSVADEKGDHVTLVDLYSNKKKYPEKWSRFKYTYYISDKKTQGKDINNSQNTVSSSMKKFTLSNDDLKSHTLQQLFNKGMNILPEDTWYDFSLKVTVAKAFSDDSADNLDLRNLIIRTKFNAVAYINTVYVPPQVSSKLFEIDPYTFTSLTDFISFAEPKIPSKLRLDCLFALECISLKHVWCSDIMRNLGGNLSHGTLFQILRQISKLLRTEEEEISEEYNVRFFYLISNLADVKTLHDALLSAGLIPCLLDIISVKQTTYKRTIASATHLLEVFINDSESTNEFITDDGFNILINSITDEVNFSIEHPEYGKPSQYSVESYSISFRQQAYIRSLLKLVFKLLKTDSGDRIRNLIDSPILASLKQILENRPVFSYTLVTFTLDIIQRVINSEPTIYQILVEAGLIPYIIDHFEEFIGPSSDLLFLLPDVISALCLNKEGLEKVKEKKMVKNLFTAMLDPEYAELLSFKDEATDIGSYIDELGRHYPDLKEQINDCFCEMIKRLPSQIKFEQPFLYKSPKNESYFYHSKDEKVVDEEEGTGELEFWDVQKSATVLDCFSNVFYGMGLENSTLGKMPEILKIEDLLPLLVLDRPPFDYSSSQTIINFSDVLQLIDEIHPEYGFVKLLSVLDEKLKSMSDFLKSDNNTSYFLSADGNGNPVDIDRVLGELSGLTSLLYIITSVYITTTSLSPARLLQIIDYFDENGYDLIQNLRYLFQKCALEEMYVRQHLPDEVVTQTLPENHLNSPPIRICVTIPKKGEQKDNKTSTKFKNTYQTRYFLNKLQSYTSSMYRCFLRLTHLRNMDIELSDKSTEIRIFDIAVEQLISMLDIGLDDSNISYYLVVLHFNTYVMTYSKTTITTNEILQTLPALLFYQKGGYKLYTDIVMKLFSKLLTIKNVSSIEEIYYVKDNDEILTISCIINALSFISRATRSGALENIKSMAQYYPNNNREYNVSHAFSLHMKKIALSLVMNLVDEHHIFELKSRSVPYTIFKGILTIISNTFMPTGFDEGYPLYELRWDLIPASRAKINLLMDIGWSEDVSRAYLEENDDKLPETEDWTTFNKEEWSKLKLLMAENIDVVNTKPRDLQLEVCDGTSLVELRKKFYDSKFEDGTFKILPFYPKLVNAFSQTALQVLGCLELPLEPFMERIFNKILDTKLDNRTALSSLIHIFGILLNEGSVYKGCESLLEKYVYYVQKLLSPEFVNTPWFSKALYAFEVILAKSELPIAEELSVDVATRLHLTTLNHLYHIPEVIKEKIFDIIIRVNDITNFYSAISIARILLFYAKCDKFRNTITRSGILAKILKVIGIYQKSEKINFLEASYLLLIRRCFETSNIVSSLIKHEIDKSFTTRTLGEQKPKERELNSLLEEKPHVVLRDSDKFVDKLCQSARFVEFDNDDTLWNFTLKKITSESTDDKSSSSIPEINFNKRSGVVHLLLSQLMAASKKDWLSEPKEQENPNKISKVNKEKPDPSRNPVCAYMIFLLKLLIELVTSYKQCKYEFLTYDRRNTYTEHPKPRTTALNFVLYQILDKFSAKEQDKDEMKRKEVISMLAKSVIVGFVTSVQDDKNKKLDPKQVDPDMTFIRKYTIECIIKALRSTTESERLLESNVSKIDTWFNIISLMLYIQAPYLRLLLDANKIEADRYQICKLMIDLSVPSTITDCMASLDLNYPFSKKLYNEGVEVLNAITTTRNDFVDLFKIENNEEDVVVEDESDKEETSNMFKNSTLSMYDVDDIEEDDDGEDDEESLIGDDEDIAFVDNDDDGFQVVFSDDGMDDENDEDSSFDEDDNLVDDNMIFNIDRDGMEVEIENSDDEHSFDEEESVSNLHSDSDIEVISISGSEDLDVDLSDYSIEESDWESGLSDLASSDQESNENHESDTHEDNILDSIRRVWTIADGVELEEEPSDEETRGVFQGIEHTFNPANQNLFRVQQGLEHGRHHQRTLHRLSHAPSITPSLTLLSNNRHNQSNLINPLGPSGLEQMENDISEQLVSIRSGIRPRTIRPHFSDVLLSGELFDERAIEGIILKSSVARWRDIYDMFYDSKSSTGYLVPEILNRLYKPSVEYTANLTNKAKEKLHNVIKTQKVTGFRDHIESNSSSDDEHFVNDEVTNGHNLEESTDEEHHDTVPSESNDHEPVYVTIGGTEVDIGGTDIDPEFVNALPEDMRAEVLAQHVRERRAESLQHDLHSREIDPGFLEALPSDLRNDILDQEMNESRLSNIVNPFHETHEHDDDDHDMLSDDEVTDSNDESGEEHNDTHDGAEKKKSNRVYFDNLLDRTGIAALMKSVFLSQPYVQREIYHELFYRLCFSKQNRSDIINLLLVILTEGTFDQHSLDRVYNLIANRSHRSGKSQNIVVRQLPPDCTPLVAANQAIEILQNLIDTDGRLKFFFITEHDNLMVNKTLSKAKKDIFNKNEKWPIKYLFSLLDKKLITDETVLMDLLTNILQTCTKPIGSMLKNSQHSDNKKKFQIPLFGRNDFDRLVSIIKQDSCNTKVFQQTLNVMYNLSSIENTLDFFTEELIELAKITSSNLYTDLTSLSKETAKAINGSEMDNELIQKITVPSSDQAKLLKILTAVDFLHTHKIKPEDYDLTKLSGIYNKMGLGKVWSALSKCLTEFEKRKDLNTSATILLPSIESLMVVCKYSNISKNGAKITKFEEEKKLDFSTVQVENLFFPFTDIHKKLLNQMIRSNPKLMGGPFSLLVKNPKILEFDNKRYYFIAKLQSEGHTKPKLPITVRRDQVFLDSYRSLFFKSNDEVKDSKLEITFKGESGVDAGGLTREWYQVLSRQMFNPDYALFLPIASDKTTFHPNRTSGINPEHLSFFKFSGMIIGKAIRDQCYLDCHFSREVYKNLLGRPVALKDMESIDLDYYKSLVWILENDITDIIEETFSVETDDYGEHKVIDLIEDGSNIAVTESNKQEYVQKIVDYKLHKSVKEQMDNFLVGFYSLIPQELISIFDEQELELLISGLPDVDVDDWKNNSTYVNYTASCKQVNYFWRAVRSFDTEERAKLLQFVTGTSKVPLNGFKELSGVGGVCKFSIHRDYGSTERLPSSHTCFNQLNLPAYNSYETLRGSLLLAINEGYEGFGLA